MEEASRVLERKTGANHFKGRFAMGGHMYISLGADPALVFRAHGIFQRRYEIAMRLSDIKTVRGSTAPAKLAVTLSDGSSQSFLVARGTGLLQALEDARRFLQQGAPADHRDDNSPHYWATGDYDPERYYSETKGWSTEYRNYVKDAYGDLDTYNANRPD